jgi:hypothetical protein
VKPDPYYVEKALSKAQRNAKASLLPKSFVIEMLKNIKEGKAKSEKAAPKKEKAVPAKTAPAKTPPAKTAPPAQPTAEQKGFDMNVLRNNAIAGLKKLAPTGIQIPILWEHLTGTKKTSEVPEAILKKIAADCNRKDARLQTFAARWMIRVDKEVFFYDPKGMTDAMKAAVRKEFEGDTPTTPPPQGDAGPKPEDEF